MIAKATAESVGHAVGFRNILVYEYLDCDDDEVIANLDRLDDLHGFITQVSRPPDTAGGVCWRV